MPDFAAFYKKAVTIAGFIFRHVILVFIACLPATAISVFLWAVWQKGLSAKLMHGIIGFTSMGVSIMSPFVIFVYLPIALIIWRFRVWPITFPITGAIVSSAVGALLFGKGLNNFAKDGVAFMLLFTLPGALTALFHYALLYKTEALIPSMKQMDDRKPMALWIKVAIGFVLACAASMAMFQSFAPKKLKESCLHDVTVEMAGHELLVPRKYWPPKSDDPKQRPQSTIESQFYMDEEWRPMSAIQKKCDLKKMEKPFKIFVGNIKITDHKSDPYGPAWYEKRLKVINAAKDKTRPVENPALEKTINPDNGKTLFVLPVTETNAKQGAPIIMECTEPEVSGNLKEKQYKGVICYTNYEHESSLQVGYKIPYTLENVGEFVTIDRMMQKQVQTMLDDAKDKKYKSKIDLTGIPMERHGGSDCNNMVTFTFNGHRMKADLKMFRDVSIDGHGTSNRSSPQEDCSMEDLGNVTELGGDYNDDTFTMTALSKGDAAYWLNPNRPQTPANPNKREFTGRVNNTFDGMQAEKLPLDKHPTLNGEPVFYKCLTQMHKKCLVRYMHPLGFWVSYERKLGLVDGAEGDLAVRRKIDEMIEAGKEE